MCVFLTERHISLKHNSLMKCYAIALADSIKWKRLNFNSFVISHQFFIHPLCESDNSSKSIGEAISIFFILISSLSQSIKKSVEYADVCTFFVFYTMFEDTLSALEFHFLGNILLLMHQSNL